MNSVNFIFKNSPLSLSFVFKTYKNADELFKKASASLRVGFIEAEDDFGGKCKIDMESVAGISLSEIEKEMDKRGEVSLLEVKAQTKFQNRANSETKILQPKLVGPISAN